VKLLCSNLCLLLALAASACDRPQVGPVVSSVTTAPVAGQGSVRGKVFITNWTAPSQTTTHICLDHPTPIPDQSVLVTSNGTLRNVVVFLKQIPHTVYGIPPAEPVILDQIGCIYKPRIVALRTGQTLRVKSSDNTPHNVHTFPEANQAVNFGMLRPGHKDLSFKSPEFIPVKCDVHPWMRAHIAVFDHPFFTITADDGMFELNDVPAGAYTLIAWHERFGELQQSIDLKDNSAAHVTFTYKPPQQDLLNPEPRTLNPHKE
jgi:hypothetical protein